MVELIASLFLAWRKTFAQALAIFSHDFVSSPAIFNYLLPIPAGAIGLVLLVLSASSHSLEFPYVFKVDHLACEAALAANKCELAVDNPLIVARQTSSGCGYFKQGEEGPLENRWFTKCDPVFISGYARVCNVHRDNSQSCGLIDEGLNLVIPIVYDELRLVKGMSIVAVNYGNKWGYFSLTEKRLLFPPQFSYVTDFSEGLAYVIDADDELTAPAWIIDDKGLRVAPVERNIKVSGHFADGLIPAEIDFRWGYLNSKGGWAIDPQFYVAESFVDGIAAVQYGSDPDKWAIINPEGAGLIFFEGSAHQLTLADTAKAKLSIGCETTEPNSREFGRSSFAGDNNGSAAKKICYQICFNPLQQTLGPLCKTD